MSNSETTHSTSQTVSSSPMLHASSSQGLSDGISTTNPSPPSINITYDKLFEILRIERNDPNLQKLPATFFADVRAYLQLKQDSIEKSKRSSDLFAAEHIETSSQQVRNALRILADIYDRRERKIMNLALNKSKSSSAPIDTANLLAEEKPLFAQIVSLLCAQRNTTRQLLEVGSAVPMPSRLVASAGVSIDLSNGSQGVAISDALVASGVSSVSSSPADKSYVVTGEIAEFFGPDMQHYGPYAVGDAITVPEAIAKILLKKNLIK